MPFTPYAPRPVRFLGAFSHEDWRIKLYSVSVESEFASDENIALAKAQLGDWLKNAALYDFETYKTATLVVHDGRGGCYALLNWWIGENMLQHFVYIRREGEATFTPFSDKGIIACVWEMAAIWHDRNAWVKHVLMQADRPDIAAYLQDGLNADI